jgi:endonuclease/exonuclease/phosphatase family metal-dependent hydrolase
MGKMISDLGIQIAGLQENDVDAERSDFIDVPKAIAQAAGMSNHVFKPSINIDELGWYYGNAIISAFPIESTTFIPLPSAGLEQRGLLHSIINVGDLRVNFFNTHLTNYEADETGAVRAGQFKYLQEILSKNRPFIITGDFNTLSFDEYSALEKAITANSSAKPIITFPEGGPGGYHLDNVIVSDDLTISNIGVSPANYSDHLLIYADVTIPINEDASISKSNEILLTIGNTSYIRNGVTGSISQGAPFTDTNYNRTMVPVDFVAKAFDAEVAFDSTAHKVTITRGDVKIELQIDTALQGGMGKPTIRNGQPFVPIAYVSKMFGAQVTWNADTQTVFISD